MLSKQMIESYVKSGGDHCPYCENEEVVGDAKSFEFDDITRTTSCINTCLTCGAKWKDISQLVTIEEIPK